MKYSLVILLLLITISLNVSGQTSQGDRRFIFPAERKVMLLDNDSIAPRFTPTIAEIDSIDIYLKKYLYGRFLGRQKGLEFDSSYRQYVGFSKDGQKFIYVNASCIKPGYFDVNTYFPKGGGKCYYRTNVSLQDKLIRNFYFNTVK